MVLCTNLAQRLKSINFYISHKKMTQTIAPPLTSYESDLDLWLGEAIAMSAKYD